MIYKLQMLPSSIVIVIKRPTKILQFGTAPIRIPRRELERHDALADTLSPQ